MAARPIVERTPDGADPSPGDTSPWRVVVPVLLIVVGVLGVMALVVVASLSGLVSDVWQAATSVFGQP